MILQFSVEVDYKNQFYKIVLKILPVLNNSMIFIENKIVVVGTLNF